MGWSWYNLGVSSDAWKAQKQLMREQMAWEERMSNTAHQREVSDLRAAGLNPILTATGGSGASTPSAPSPTVAAGSTNVIDLLKNVASVASGATEIGQNIAEIDNITQDTALKAAQMMKTYGDLNKQKFEIEKIMADTDLSKAQKDNYIKQLGLIDGQIKNIESQTALNHESLNTAKQTTRQVKALADATENENKITNNKFYRFTRHVGNVTGAIGNVFRGSVNTSYQR